MWVSKKKWEALRAEVRAAASDANYCRVFMNKRVEEMQGIVGHIDGVPVDLVVELLLDHLKVYVHKPSAKPILGKKGGPELAP